MMQDQPSSNIKPILRRRERQALKKDPDQYVDIPNQIIPVPSQPGSDPREDHLQKDGY